MLADGRSSSPLQSLSRLRLDLLVGYDRFGIKFSGKSYSSSGVVGSGIGS